MTLSRREFVRWAGLGAAAGIAGLPMLSGCVRKAEEVLPELASGPATERMSALFVGHGSPMNTLADNVFTQNLRAIGASLPKPKTVLMVSAHWQTEYCTLATAMERPPMVYDIQGFPKELYEFKYDCPGNAELAKSLYDEAPGFDVEGSQDFWGLDHGAWSVLTHLFPEADVPVVQLSMMFGAKPDYHFQLGRALSALRDRGVMVIGSGNLVHNLRKNRGAKPYDWAIEFDEYVKDNLLKRNDQALVEYAKAGACAPLSHPTNDHYLPLLYVLGTADRKETVSFPSEGFQGSAISMRCALIGGQG